MCFFFLIWRHIRKCTKERKPYKIDTINSCIRFGGRHDGFAIQYAIYFILANCPQSGGESVSSFVVYIYISSSFYSSFCSFFFFFYHTVLLLLFFSSSLFISLALAVAHQGSPEHGQAL